MDLAFEHGLKVFLHFAPGDLDQEAQVEAAAFFDGVGTIRDVVQNHLLQLLAILAMEPPVSDDAGSLRDEVVKLMRSVRPLEPDAVVRGQYRGYRDHDGVAPGSDTDTFAAVRFEIDSWRWAGVPFLVRAGKAMAATVSVARLRCREDAFRKS